MSSAVHPETPPRIGVVTVTYNCAADIPDFMSSLATQQGVELTLYVVDNASRDNCVELIRQADHGEVTVKIIDSPVNLGFAEGNNVGIRAALADGVDWVLMLNNDTVFASDLCATLVRTAQAAGVSLISPVIEGIDPPGTLWYGGATMTAWQGHRVHHTDAGRLPAAQRVTQQPAELTDFAPACCLLVAPEVFDKAGLMDGSYFVYQEDVDFAVRAKRAGYRYAVTSAARLTHKVGNSTGGERSDVTLAWLTRNWVLLARRYLPIPQRWAAFVYMQCRLIGGEFRYNGSWRTYALRQRWFWRGLHANLDDHSVPDPSGRSRS